MWYRKYGWHSNPFFVKPSPLLVGLENERKSLKEFATSENIFFLHGPTGSGKTSLLFWLKNELNKTHTPIYLNCVKISKIDDLTAVLRRQCGLLDKLLFRPCPKNTVLALDEAQVLQTKAGEFIKVLWDEGSIHSIILASINKDMGNFTDSFKNRIGDRIVELTKLTKSEAIDLVKLRAGRNNPFDADALEKLAELAGYSPRGILELSERICKTCAEKGAKTINRADIEELISPAYATPTKLVGPPEKVEAVEGAKLVSHEVKLVKPPTKLTKLAERAPIKLSPLQATLIQLLRSGDKTMAELSAVTGSSVGTVGKQLSILRSKNIITSIEDVRPKKYVLYNKKPFIEQKEGDIAEKILECLERVGATNSAKAVSKDYLLDAIKANTDVFETCVKSLEVSGKIIVIDGKEIYLVKV